MIELINLSKTYRKPKEPPVRALDGVSLTIAEGEWLAILGPSGSGKSTLMNVLGLLDRPDTGEYRLRGRPVENLPDDELAGLRNRTIGFVFQSYHLLPRATARENVELPLLYAVEGAGGEAGSVEDPRARSAAALAAVGLADRANHFAEELSGGQQQRVAIARALVTGPSLLLADEPTGNLDSVAAAEILALFAQLHDRGATIAMITHDEDVARRASRVVRIRDGRIESDGPAESALGAVTAPPRAAEPRAADGGAR